MRAFAAFSLLAGLVAAHYGQDGYGSDEHESAAPSTVVLTSTEFKTMTHCAGGCEKPTNVPAPLPTPVVPSPVLPETCVPSTITVTVTVPPSPTGAVPTGVPSAPPSYPSAGVPYSSGTIPKPSVGKPSGYYPPTTPTPSPPAFTGAASHANAGLFVAGAGAFAAFFL